MASSKRLFNRERSVHQILGGGFVADVILWRRKNITLGIAVIVLYAWLVFEKLDYTLLSLVSNVLLLLFSIIFLWAKSAAILNRPAPGLPDLCISEEVVNNISVFIRIHLNELLSLSKDIALGGDTRMFFKVATSLLLISFIGGLTDFLTLGYTSLIVFLTVPALYDKYEDYIDRYILTGFSKLQELYLKFDVEILGKVQNWILEKKKLN